MAPFFYFGIHMSLLLGGRHALIFLCPYHMRFFFSSEHWFALRSILGEHCVYMCLLRKL